jgi:hypothetical protein
MFEDTELDPFLFIAIDYPFAAKVGKTLLHQSDGMMRCIALAEYLEEYMTADDIVTGIEQLGPLVTITNSNDKDIGNICTLNRDLIMSTRDLRSEFKAVREWMDHHYVVVDPYARGEMRQKKRRGGSSKPRSLAPPPKPGLVMSL